MYYCAGNHQRIQMFNNGTLFIQATKTADRGEYICEIETKGFEPVVSKPATISVIGKKINLFHFILYPQNTHNLQKF